MKVRGNLRWRSMIEQISMNGIIDSIYDVYTPGGSIITAPTSISFFMQLQHSFQYPDPTGKLVADHLALKYAIAQMMVSQWQINATVYNALLAPPGGTAGSSKQVPSGLVTELITVGQLATDIPTAVSAITITV